jgi:hypothetical protein
MFVLIGSRLKDASEERVETERTFVPLTDAGIVNENRWVTVGVADGAAEIDQVGEVGDVALVIVDIWN